MTMKMPSRTVTVTSQSCLPSDPRAAPILAVIVVTKDNMVPSQLRAQLAINSSYA